MPNSEWFKGFKIAINQCKQIVTLSSHLTPSKKAALRTKFNRLVKNARCSEKKLTLEEFHEEYR